MNPTAARHQANRLASTHPEQALEIARSIDASWFKCQALSQVARFWPDERYVRILAEAVAAADAQDQVYNQVAVSAWPIRAFLERGNSLPAKDLLSKGIHASAAIENMGSRSQALFSIFEASKPFTIDIWRPVFAALVEATEPSLAWRQLRNLKNAVAMVIANDPEVAQQSLEKLSEPKNISTVKRYIDTPILAVPRGYFFAEIIDSDI